MTHMGPTVVATGRLQHTIAIRKYLPPSVDINQVSSQAAIVTSLHESVHSNLDKYDRFICMVASV